jgi:hypothetical protein
MNHYINNPPWAVGGSSGGTTTCPMGRHQGKLTGERAAAKARLADVLQRESVLEASRAMEKEPGEQQLPTFTTAN